ncbi:MAG: serine/threonine protein kinase [Chloroflexi bacterium]|nr:serine/threonine protein kinase [Chloroflexota bacterium]
MLGRGGMGVAYRAWDPDLKRLVAVKMLRAADADESEIARFRVESEAIARVRHPNIVQVFDVGEEAGQPFFAMEYCAGGSLAGRLKAGPFAPTEAAGVVEQIARGVDAAHNQNIIHRDLKPANVLLSHDPRAPSATGASTNAGGATVPGSSATGSAASGPAGPGPVVYKVTDFGLAKALDADEGYTRSGAILGTPCYMSPEQAFGQGSKVGPAADVYALGAILYECLTGRPPFQGATVPDTLDQVRAREPVPVRQLQPAVPVDLETIVLKCLQKDTAKRYASAADAADDLRRFLEGRPIHARPVGAAERAVRWCRRNKLVAGLIAGVFVVFALGLTGTTIMWRKAVANAKEEQIQRGKADDRMRLAHEAVTESFVSLSEERILQEPHLMEFRRGLLARAKPYFEKFVAENRDDPKWKRELTSALTRLALLSQQLEPPEVALKKWRETIPLWEEQARENPGAAEPRIELAKAHVSVAYQARKAGKWDVAQHNLSAAVRHLRDVPDRDGRGYDVLALEANALAYLASSTALLGDAPGAAPLHQEALKAQRRAVERYPGPLAQLDLGVVHFLRGQSLFRIGDADAGVPDLRAAVKLLRATALAPSRERPIALRNLASALSELGIALRNATRLAGPQTIGEAAQSLSEAHDLWEQLTTQFPNLMDFQVSFSETKFQLAGIGLDTKQLADAENVARSALTLRLQVQRLHPQDAAFVRDVMDSLAQVRTISQGQLAAADGTPNADKVATALAADAGAELDFLAAHAQAGNPAFHARLSELSASRARLLAQLGRANEARAEWGRAIRFAPPDLRAKFQTERDAPPPAPKKG